MFYHLGAETYNGLFVLLQVAFLYGVYFVFLRLTKPIVWKKEFSFCLARKSFEISLKKEDEDKKMHYLKYGSYNIYLQKALGLQIKDVSRIYDKIIRCSVEGKSALIKQFLNSLECGERLDLVRELAKLLPNQEYASKQDLIDQKLGQRIKEWSTVVIPIVTTLIASISLFHNQPVK